MKSGESECMIPGSDEVSGVSWETVPWVDCPRIVSHGVTRAARAQLTLTVEMPSADSLLISSLSKAIRSRNLHVGYETCIPRKLLKLIISIT